MSKVPPMTFDELEEWLLKRREEEWALKAASDTDGERAYHQGAIDALAGVTRALARLKDRPDCEQLRLKECIEVALALLDGGPHVYYAAIALRVALGTHEKTWALECKHGIPNFGTPCPKCPPR